MVLDGVTPLQLKDVVIGKEKITMTDSISTPILLSIIAGILTTMLVDLYRANSWLIFKFRKSLPDVMTVTDFFSFVLYLLIYWNTIRGTHHVTGQHSEGRVLPPP